MDYEKWYEHIRKTRIDKSHNGIKIYKHLLLLAMLERGENDWWKPITPKAVAPYFHRFLTDNRKIRDLSFSDEGKKKYWYKYDEKYIASIIKTNPMRHWGSVSNFEHGKFCFDLDIPYNYRKEVYFKTKAECIERIQDELGFKIDAMINLHETYNYYKDVSENLYVAESEREGYVKQRLTQGKFRNRLLEKYDKCLMCGIENEKLLIGSHIKPWRVSNNFERIDVNNGLILCPNHDKLFDRGFISFDGEGNIILSPVLKQSNDNKKLLLDVGLSIEFNSDNYKYLKYHRDNIFMK